MMKKATKRGSPRGPREVTASTIEIIAPPKASSTRERRLVRIPRKLRMIRCNTYSSPDSSSETNDWERSDGQFQGKYGLEYQTVSLTSCHIAKALHKCEGAHRRSKCETKNQDDFLRTK